MGGGGGLVAKTSIYTITIAIGGEHTKVTAHPPVFVFVQAFDPDDGDGDILSYHSPLRR